MAIRPDEKPAIMSCIRFEKVDDADRNVAGFGFIGDPVAFPRLPVHCFHLLPLYRAGTVPRHEDSA